MYFLLEASTHLAINQNQTGNTACRHLLDYMKDMTIFQMDLDILDYE